MEYRPLISVAFTCYNNERFLSDSVMSVIHQDYPLWEICFVDDCSEDNSIDTFKRYVIRHKVEKKVKIYRHAKNYGYGASLYHAIKYSNGELVAILDSDDAFCDNKALSHMVHLHGKYPFVSLAYSNYWECSEDLRQRRVVKNTDLKGNDSVLGRFIGRDSNKYAGNDARVSHLKVFKRAYYDLTEGIDPTLMKAVDRDLTLKLEEIGKLVHTDVPLYSHRGHQESISYTFARRPQKYKDMVLGAKNEMYRKALERRGNKTLEQMRVKI